MRVGIIGRSEKVRGLGIQTKAYCDHLHPAKTLIIDVGHHENFPIYPEEYPNVSVVPMADDGTLPERKVRRWLTRLDVILFAESPMDWRVCDWARDVGARTVCHVNPEFYRHHLHRLPHPDGWWAPTTWRVDQLPDGTRVVPLPVDLTKFPNRHAWRDQPPRPPRFLHPAGKVAAFDRNGTECFVRACYLARTLDATIATLEPLPAELEPAGDWVHLDVGGVPNYWEVTAGYDVVVLPRRYGGLCMGAQEAMAAGLAVVMPDWSPNPDMWPIVPAPATRGGRVPLPAGWMPLCDVDPAHLANVLLRLQDDPAALAAARDASLRWAETHSWDTLAELYERELRRVIDGPLPAPTIDQRANDPFAARH